MPEIRQRYRFIVLLIAQVSLILLLPVITSNDLMIYAVSILYNITLFFSIYILAERKRLLLYGLALAMPSFIISGFDIYSLNPGILVNLRLISSLSVNIFVIAFLLNYIFKTKKVTINIIFASICIYLLLGLTWSMAYTLLEFNIPGSFYGLAEIAKTSDIDAILVYYLNSFLYYSYITLTTLGYGNIHPLNDYGNALASLEALTGQLYIAILIGRLLGMHIAQTTRE